MAMLPPTPVSAQQAVQRIPVSSILGRLDRLESEIGQMRRQPGGDTGEISIRIGQLEGELRRLTGIVERLEYDAGRQAEISGKRILDLETRLQAIESQPQASFAARSPQDPVSVGPLETSPTLAPPPVPFAQSPGPLQPTVKLGGEPAVAFGAPRQVDTSPDLAALPFPTIPVPNQSQPDSAVAVAGASVQPLQPIAAPVPMPVTPAPPPSPSAVALSLAGPQAQYDEALRMLNLGEFDAAGAALETLVAQYPQDPVAGSAQYWLGDMHLRIGRFNEAAKAFLESFKGWPEGAKAPDSLLKLGMTLAGLGQREEACLTFTEFPVRYPNASPTLLRRAQIEAERTQCGG